MSGNSPETSEHHEVVSNIYRFNNGNIHVEVDGNNLREDLINEAARLGVSGVEATEFAKKTFFHFGSPNTSPIKPPDRYKGKNDIFGCVYPYRLNNGQEGCICCLDVASFVDKALGKSESRFQKLKRLISGQKRLETYDVPENAPIEVKETAVRQISNSIWRHEREHLLQHMRGIRVGDEEDAYDQGKMDRNKPNDLFKVTVEK